MHRMHHVYAVEPAAITESRATCRYLAELFGFDQGRLLSKYPKKWVKEAINAANDLPQKDKNKVVETLLHLKRHASCRQGRDFDPAIGTWLDNAVEAHSNHPFRAIVATQANGHEAVVTPEDVTRIHPLFEVRKNPKIPREATAIAGAMAPLIACSRRILMIDRYYDPCNHKHQKTLLKILDIAKNGDRGKEFEIHYCKRSDGPDNDTIKEVAAEKFSGIIPASMTVKIIQWRRKTKGENFHARYLLTDRGGIGVEAGFSSEGTHETTRMDLLDDASRQEIIEDLVPFTGTFEHVPPILEIDEHGAVTPRDSLPSW